MKKLVTKLTTLALVAITAVAFTACGGSNLNFGKKLVKTEAQIDVLTELKSGTADVGIMDSVMAGYYMVNSADYKDELMIVPGLTLADENYGIAARKNSELIKAVNNALIDLKEDGTLATIAAKYGLTESLAVSGEKVSVDVNESDYASVRAKGKLVVGYTVFAPIAYKNADNELIGFDIELPKAVANKLGLSIEFQEIIWDQKIMELNAKNIDLIWNGMTITDELSENLAVSIPYLKNKQVAVIRKADKDKYTDTASMKNAVIAAEGGSAGAACVEKK